LDAQEERLQHQEEVRAPKESLANVVSAGEKDKEESKKQMDDDGRISSAFATGTHFKRV
jgi:hypothetical protein